MKNLSLFSLCFVFLLFVSCTKESENELMPDQIGIVDDNKESDGFGKLAPPCRTAFFVQGLSAGEVVTITRLPSNTVVATLGNGTHYGIDLNKNTSYIIDTQGCYGATVTWCSCGNNLGSGTINNTTVHWLLLHTSSNTSPYTICSF